jgi:Repeat of unknown function (DUF5648)
MKHSNFVRLVFVLIGGLCLVSCGDPSDEKPTAKSAIEFKRNLEKTISFAPDTSPTVYRFAKISNGAYFYTGNEEEVRLILANYPDFRYEGPVFEKSDAVSGQAIYRFANLRNGGYFFTGSAIERDIVLRDYPDFRFEGSTFAAAPENDQDASPVYRLANLRNGAYLYTLSPEERDYAVSLGIWRYEGSSFRAIKRSALAGKSWQTGVQFAKAEYDNNDLELRKTILSDTGIPMSVYYGKTAGRSIIYASRGIKASDGSLAWTVPKAIDLTSSGSPSVSYPFEEIIVETLKLHGSPNGNAIALWSTRRRCTPNTYDTKDTFNPFCAFIEYATYDASVNQWSPATTFDSSRYSGIASPSINNAGDIAIAYHGWDRAFGFDTYTSHYRVAVKRKTAPTFSVVNITTDFVNIGRIGLDNAGNFTLVYSAQPPGELVPLRAVRGNVSGTVANSETLASGRSTGYLDSWWLAVNPISGHTAVSWVYSYDSEGNGKLGAATFYTTQPNWQISSDLGTEYRFIPRAFMDDDGNARIIDPYACTHLQKRPNQNWTVVQMPNPCLAGFSVHNEPGFDRQGNYFDVEVSSDTSYNFGRWISYDAKRNRIIQKLSPALPTSGSGWLLGFLETNERFLQYDMLMAPNGNGLIVNRSDYATWPTTVAQNGTRRVGYFNLWSLYLN